MIARILWWAGYATARIRAHGAIGLLAIAAHKRGWITFCWPCTQLGWRWRHTDCARRRAEQLAAEVTWWLTHQEPRR